METETLQHWTHKPFSAQVFCFFELPTTTLLARMSSDKCGNCDCADNSQCTKKGNSMVISETVNSGFADNCALVDASFAETDGKCKCGPSCTCTSCTCGH